MSSLTVGLCLSPNHFSLKGITRDEPGLLAAFKALEPSSPETR